MTQDDFDVVSHEVNSLELRQDRRLRKKLRDLPKDLTCNQCEKVVLEPSRWWRPLGICRSCAQLNLVDIRSTGSPALYQEAAMQTKRLELESEHRQKLVDLFGWSRSRTYRVCDPGTELSDDEVEDLRQLRVNMELEVTLDYYVDGDELRAARVGIGMSSVEFAARCGWCKQRQLALERRTGKVTQQTAMTLSEALGLKFEI